MILQDIYFSNVRKSIKIKHLIIAALTIIALSTAWVLWSKLASPTKIALIDFQPFQAAALVKANTDKFIQYEEISSDHFAKLKHYDFVLGLGMGMRITAEQRALIQVAADKGIPVYIHAATNPENKICNLDSLQLKGVQDYLNNGNKQNYQSLALFIRQQIDKKSFFVTPPAPFTSIVSDVFYHLDEKVWFDTLEAYEDYLRKNNFYIEKGAKVAIVGGLNDPFSGNRENIDSLIVSFIHAGMNVYPVSSFGKRLSFLRAINPDAVVYFPHGRLAMGQMETAVDWLKERNIPLFSPLSIIKSRQEWENDPMGMLGGFLAQSVVMPELDGAIYPYVVNAQEIDKDGFYLFKAIPERLHRFSQIVTHYISLKKKTNAEKKLAIYYFKGAGKESLTAQGLETVPALYNLLKKLKSEGYTVDNLPADAKAFEQLLMAQGAVLSTYAEGVFDDFLTSGQPALIEKSDYEAWIKKAIPEKSYQEVRAIYGEAPGHYMSLRKAGKEYLAVARIQLGNIALLPQPMAGLGNDAFTIVHGAKTAPPHTYIGAYLWAQYAFNADAMLHFGTHGSLEFTPQKQVALSNNDWPDILTGSIPHFYYYSIGNVGESIMAKRRSYATLISYLSPAFMESNTRKQFKSLMEQIATYYKTDESTHNKVALKIKEIAIGMGIHRDLRLDSTLSQPYTEEEIARIENFAEEISNEKMMGQLYITGIPYDQEKIRSTVMAMTVDPIAYSLATLDRLQGKVSAQQLNKKVFFTTHYATPAKAIVQQLLNNRKADNTFICQLAGISTKELEEVRSILTPAHRGRMTAMAQTYTKDQKEWAGAIAEIERTVNNVVHYKTALEKSPEKELQSILNALAGGYIAPSSGGDAVANPQALPTGRNLYAINAEATPSETAWDKGVLLAKATLEQYLKQHGCYPRKISYTFWSSEFIETEGATIAQVLYMLGVEPVRDAFGRVSDLRLIPSGELGRPRIDVVVQTSGQFRDLAASRLSLISRAVEMAATAKEDKFDNNVNKSTVEIERLLVEQGLSPKAARELSGMRIFGGINGMYGTGIQNMVTAGDKWESEKEIAETYLNNMGAVYGNDQSWGTFNTGLLRAVLHNTDAVVQPRQSNSWGALSLDHVYEFMGGMNLAIRNVTGKDPEAYFSDYRNRNRVKIQELQEAIGIESRTTVFNPEYIREIMKGSANSAAQITDVVTNTYGWNVMKPTVVDNAMWEQFYEIYVKDRYNLGIQAFFKQENPAALQEISAVMLETARKGMWKASDEQLHTLATLHTTLVKEFGPNGSGFSGGNVQLQDFIAQKTDPENATQYKQQLQQMKQAVTVDNSERGTILKKEEIIRNEQNSENRFNGLLISGIILVAFIGILTVLRKKRKA